MRHDLGAGARARDPATGASGVVPIVLGYGNYNDECVRTDTGWRIKNRICDTVFW